MMNRSRSALLSVAAACLMAASPAAMAWPDQPVTMVLPGPPGSSPDRLTRLIADKLSQKWGQPVLIENRPGASTRLGATIVAQAEPDGHTLLSTFGTHSMLKALYPDTDFDPLEDFIPITQYAVPEIVLSVHPDSPYDSLEELVEGVKARGEPLEYAHFGTGSSFHFYGLMLGRDAGIDVLPVPYKGEALQITDLMGGHVEASFNSVGTAMPHARSGRVKPLAVIAEGQSAALPDVPTFEALGYPEFGTRGGWFGFLAPGGTPEAVVAQIETDVREVLNQPDVAKIMRDQGIEPVGSRRQDFAATMQEEAAKWQRLMKEFDVSVQ